MTIAVGDEVRVHFTFSRSDEELLRGSDQTGGCGHSRRPLKSSDFRSRNRRGPLSEHSPGRAEALD
jgi:hypothetical protein